MSAVRLKSIRYWEKVGKPKEWTLEGLLLGSVNLLVGTNATGKTRTLNSIGTLARLFYSGQHLISANAGYDALFDSDGQEIRYVLDIVDQKVQQEEVWIAGQALLVRRTGGAGEIFTKEEKRMIRFRPPENELAAVARRDSLQHPFLEPLHEWALAVRHYTFGTSLGRDFVMVPAKAGPEANERDPNQVVGIFRRAEKDLGPRFLEAVIQDMSELHYHLDGITVHTPEGIQLLREGLPTDVLVLGVKEQGVEDVIDQTEISQGMFRVLSILIQVNYSQMAERASCILIDDIGEGLDFERSSQLIHLLRRKASTSSFQLIMTTNDKFVMNSVPLNEWSILQRQGGRVRVRNYLNSREVFADFEETGLSNFSFFEMDFANATPQEEPKGEPVAHE